MLDEWQPSDHTVAGFRAPIKLRKNGVVCDTGFAASWVGIYSTVNDGIAQAGWVHLPGRYCRFYEWNDGHGFDTMIQKSRCDQDADGDIRLYKVQEVFIPQEDAFYYSIYDCAASDWSTCTLLSGGPRVSDLGGSVLGGAVSEVNTGGTACTNDMMGSEAQPTLYGGNDPIKGMHLVGGTWSVRDLTYVDDAVCPQYVSPTHTNDTFRVYDSNT